MQGAALLGELTSGVWQQEAASLSHVCDRCLAGRQVDTQADKYTGKDGQTRYRLRSLWGSPLQCTLWLPAVGPNDQPMKLCLFLISTLLIRWLRSMGLECINAGKKRMLVSLFL